MRCSITINGLAEVQEDGEGCMSSRMCIVKASDKDNGTQFPGFLNCPGSFYERKGQSQLGQMSSKGTL